MTTTQQKDLAHLALKGTALGDAFGELFFGETSQMREQISRKEVPEGSWEFTDDTVMSIAVNKELVQEGKIIPDSLIRRFVEFHKLDPNRGYGATARRILREIEEGGDWVEIANSAFEGMGSMGNGAAMRVAPIGAWFWDDWVQLKEMAMLSAKVTHANPEAFAGAIAVALAVAIATTIRVTNTHLTADAFLAQIIEELPDSDLRSKVNKARHIPADYRIETVVSALGNGTKMLVQDTVPIALWCAAHHLNNYEEALWKAVSALGDRDTICAIVGGIVMLSAPAETVPQHWQEKVEKIEKSSFWRT